MPKQDIVVIGASAGGIEALQIVAGGLPSGLEAAIFVVLHIGKGIDGQSILPEILAAAGPLPCSHPTDGEEVQQGRIYIARPDCHMLLNAGNIRVVDGPKENLSRPAINPLFRSAATAYGSRVTGVILTGMLDDGVAGLAEIKRCGGVAIVQDPTTALFPSMPCNAIAHVEADYVSPLEDIARVISQLAATDRQVKEVQEPVKRTLLETKCPDCFGPLWEERQGRIVEYRCRIGHAYSALALMDRYEETVEMTLRHSLVTLLQANQLEVQLAPELGPDDRQQKAQRMLDQADVIRRMLEQHR